MIRKLLLVLAIAFAGTVAAQSNLDEDEQARSLSQVPLNFVGERYRIGVGIDTEFDFTGEFQASLVETETSALIGEGWLGRKGAGGLKLNYHWLFSGATEEGVDGPVHTDGRIAKLFIAGDQNQFDDRKITFGGGYERQDWFFGVYGMRAITSERLVNRVLDVEDILVTGQIDSRDFSRIDTLERMTETFEKPYDWGVGLRGGRYFDGRLVRLRGGLDYEEGDFSSSQLTASLSLDKYFQNTPHSLSLRTGYARKSGDFVEDRNDWRAALVYGYSFGRSYQPSRAWRETEVEIMPEPRYEEREVTSEVTLSDQATFEFDSSALRTAARQALSELIEAIRDGGLVGTIEVVGHTCDIGTAEYNQGLSERRARSVVDFLRDNGIESDEVNWSGRGLTEPRYPNDSEENRSRNRRVEISFTTLESTTERIQVSPDGPVTEIRRIEKAVEAPWIRRALRNPVQHKRHVDYYRYQEVTETLTEGEVEFANQPPTANDNSFTVEQDSTENVLDVLANDTDPDGDPLTIIENTQPANGEAVISGDVILYTPNVGYFGPDSFTYTIDDGFGGQDSATVSIDVIRANQPPVANDNEFTVDSNSVDNEFDVLVNDSDPDGDPLTIVEITQPANGEATISENVILYTPATDFAGNDSFTYTIDDGRGGQDTATVSVEVVRTNQPPVANDNQFEVEQDSVDNVFDVLANDSDPDGDPLTIVEVSQPANGEVTISGDVLLYTPAPGHVGSDSFTYTIDDGFGGQDTATVSVEVVRTNQPPVANDNQFEVERDSVDNVFDVLANDSDPDGDPLTIVEVSQPANGEAVISGDVILYTPAPGYVGADSFTYTIDDGFGGQDSAQVSIQVLGENQPPEANDVMASTVRTQPVDIDVLANDFDPDGDPLEIIDFTLPSDGALTLSGDIFTYQPDQLFFGDDSFQYTISDGRGGEATATVFIEVAFANQAPVAVDDFASGPAGVPITVEVLANDFDPDGDPIEVINVVRRSLGSSTATINEDGTITFVLSRSCSGVSRFDYTITDPFGATDVATVTLQRVDDDDGESTESADMGIECGPI